jgi:hypothetical protein
LLPHLRVRFGDVEVGAAVEKVTTRTAVNELATAEFQLDLTLAGDAPVEFLAEVQIRAEYEGTDHPLFTGSVIDAETTAGALVVHCGAAPALQEQLMPPLASAGVRGVDMLYMILRSVGFTEERMQLEGLDTLPIEPFEVLVPTEGVAAEGELRVGNVQFILPSEAEDPLSSLAANEELRSRFLGAELYARVYETGARSFDVEQQALREIDSALAWLAVRAKYGLARLPDGQTPRFRRKETLAVPARRDVLLLRGLDTSRRWLRVVGTRPGEATLPLDDAKWFAPSLPNTLSLQDRQALIACRRAAAEADPLGRVTALWDAIEFYVAETELPRMFTRSELKEIRRALPETLPCSSGSGWRAGWRNSTRRRFLRGLRLPSLATPYPSPMAR